MNERKKLLGAYTIYPSYKISWVYAVLLTGILFTITTISQAAVKGLKVEKWQPHDFIFHSDSLVDNPFDIPFNAEVIGPGGIHFTQPGFYDGNGNWKVRVAPMSEGLWSLQTKSGIKTLDKLSAEFVCVTKKTKPNLNHGALKVDPENPHHFIFDDNTPFFLMGYECDWLWALDMGNPGLKNLELFLDKLSGYGFNYIILNAYAHDTEWSKGNTSADDYGPPPMFPWGGTNELPDHSRFNLAYWQHYDRIIEALNKRGMIAHIMVKVYNKKVNWPTKGSAQDDRYFKWLIARYAAYPNIHWDFSKEAWKENDMNYKVGRIQYIRDNDAYHRLITNHDEPILYKDSIPVNILDYCSDQSHGNWHANVIENSRLQNWPVVMVEFGYEHGPNGLNDRTWGMASTPEELCMRAWEIYMAGGYGVYYYTYTGWDVIKTKDTPPGYSFFKHLHDFFQKTVYMSMVPSDSLVSSGYCLARQGSEYVVFQNRPQSFSLKVEGLSNPIEAKWLNPLTGEYLNACVIENGINQLVPPNVWGDNPVVFFAK